MATSSPRARHRHGRRRPRRAGRVAGRGEPRACSASAGPATRWASRAAASSSPSTAATWSRPPSSSTACSRASSSSTRYPRNPLDVLAQQIVAMAAMDEWPVDEPRRDGAPRGALRRAQRRGAARNVLDLLAGRYPCEEFAELRPRIVWDRVARHHPRPGRRPAPGGHQRAAPSPTAGCSACSCPTAPGWASSTRRWSTRAAPGETFLLGASTWRIEDITHERVVVTPAPGQPGKMPFWHGDGPGRPLELGPGPRRVRARRSGPAPRPTGAAPPLQDRDEPRRAARRRTCVALPRRAGRGHRRGARRPHHRRRALPRRDRRLAGLRAARRSGPRSTRRGPWRCEPRLDRARASTSR